MPGPRVVWVSFVPLERTSAGLTSNVASCRYRILAPAAALKRLGRQAAVTHLGGHSNRNTILARFDRADAVVLGKLAVEDRYFAANAEAVLGLATALQERGVKVLADFCDDDFNDQVRGSYCRQLANVADAVVASTPALVAVLRGLTAVRVELVDDPVEGMHGTPRVPSPVADVLRVLWYGHSTNLRTLELALPQLDAICRKARVRLDLVTSRNQGGEELAKAAAAAWAAHGSTCHFMEWSRETTWRALAECDAVIIPSDPYDPGRAVKSPNRFTEAVWAGRFVVAHPIPAYEAFSAGGWVGDELGEGLLWLLANPDAAVERIRAGQRTVTERFAPEVVARQWLSVIDTVVKRPSR